MIKGVLIINNHGKPRLTKFYQEVVSVNKQNEKMNYMQHIYQNYMRKIDYSKLINKNDENLSINDLYLGWWRYSTRCHT